ncbi:DNA mismatch repair ATPase msh1, partial [Entomortierella beljakovae]
VDVEKPKQPGRKRGKPKETILSLGDLLSVNPNPTLTPRVLSNVVPKVVPDASIKVNISEGEIAQEPEVIQKKVSRRKKVQQEPQSPIEIGEEMGANKVVSKPIEPTRRLTPLLKQVLELEAAYPDCALLVRVGEFYELYDHHAVEYGHLLGLKMGSKSFGGQSMPFTGFPYRMLDRHLETLVGKHQIKVALCEQFQNDEEGGSGRLFRRSVHRIITPGTLIDELFLDRAENNWLLAIASDKVSHSLGLSWLDISTGDFFTQETTYENFPNDLARIRPREIILNSNLRELPDHPVIQATQNLGSAVLSFEDMFSATQVKSGKVQAKLGLSEDLFGFDPRILKPFSEREQSACWSILRYIDHTQRGRRPVVQQPIRWLDTNTVKIDKNTIESLELVRTMRDSTRMGSLLHYLDKTKTQAGSRLLSDWLTSPLTSIDKINQRLDTVDFFSKDSHIIDDIDFYLTDCRDAQRSIQKLSLGNVDPQELVCIRVTLESIRKIKQRMDEKITIVNSGAIYDNRGILEDQSVPHLVLETVDSINDLEHVCKLIEDVVDESGDKTQEYGFIKEGFSPKLNDLHVRLRELKDKKKALLDNWKNHLGGVRPFEIKSSFGYRHLVEMRNTITADRLREYLNGHITDVSHTDVKRTKVRYQVPILTGIMDTIERMEGQIIQEEKNVLTAVRSDILEESTAIIQNCRLLAQLDVLLSFAKVKVVRRYCRPILNNSDKSIIISGRHPVVEVALEKNGRHFVENGCSVGQDELIWLLTGPNMGGKSTFLRQNAIITIMAQMGSFVPAASACLGVVDKVFSRLGSADNLANSQSTFMIEMSETASILQLATEKSLVIMDEVGRGTATLDGCAIAYATLHHLYHTNKCRTLFATHYHELADMVGALDGRFEGRSAHLSFPDERLLKSGSGGELSDGNISSDLVKHSSMKTWRGQKQLDRVRCYQTTVEERPDGSFVYIHNVIPGVCRQSHGIQCAKLAGMPRSAIEVSQKILKVLQAPE